MSQGFSGSFLLVGRGALEWGGVRLWLLTMRSGRFPHLREAAHSGRSRVSEAAARAQAARRTSASKPEA